MIQHSKPNITLKDREAVDELLMSGNIASGKMVVAFEEAILKFVNSSYGIFIDSGSKGIKLALRALEITAGDEVILPTYVCHSVIDAIVSIGATPVLCDVSDNWNVSLDDVETVMSPKTKAIILVHTMGIALNVNAFRKFNVPLIEDCCQALGSINKLGQMIGTAGDLSVFSFHAIKCITTGEGGFISTNNQALYDRLKALTYAKSDRSSVSDLQAVLGLSQLNAYPKNLAIRKNIAQTYFKEIENKQLTITFQHLFEQSNGYRFLLTSDVDFKHCRAFFEAHGVAVRKGVDELLHLNYPQFAKSKYPFAERIFKKTVSIPIYPSLTQENIQYVIQLINKYDAFR